MHTGNIFTGLMCRLNMRHDFVQINGRSIDDQFSAMFYLIEQLTRNQGPCVQDNRTTINELLRFDGNQFGVTRACANEIDSHSFLL